MCEQEKEYDVALSFAGEDRDYVQAVAYILKDNEVKIFYDEFDKVGLWGKDLYTHLDDVYRLKSRYCVMFISNDYKTKLWTNHERESAQARAFKQNKEYILPARFDDTEIPGIKPTIGYIDLRGLPPEKFALLVMEKIGGSKSNPERIKSGKNNFRVPRAKGKSFNPYEETFKFISFLVAELKERFNVVSGNELSISYFEMSSKHHFRVVCSGKTIYSLDIWPDESPDTPQINFYGSRWGTTGFNQNATNARAKIYWDKEAGHEMLEFHNLSLLPEIGESNFTIDGFINVLWGVICNSIEGHA